MGYEDIIIDLSDEDEVNGVKWLLACRQRDIIYELDQKGYDLSQLSAEDLAGLCTALRKAHIPEDKKLVEKIVNKFLGDPVYSR